MQINIDRRVKVSIHTLGLICLISFFSPNSFAINCVGEDRCPNDVRKLFKFAKAGSPRAQIMLSTLYSEGTDKDIEKGLSLLIGVAEDGYTKSQTLLGVIYFQGRDTKQDMLKARAMFQMAAESNDPTAAFYLAKMLENSLGGEQNLAQARKWYNVAAGLGHQQAAEKLATMPTEMSTDLVSGSQQSGIEGIGENEEKIVIVRDEMSRLELMRLYIAQIERNNLYHGRGGTGSRIRSIICGRGADKCISTTGAKNISDQMDHFRTGQLWDSSISMNNSE